MNKFILSIFILFTFTGLALFASDETAEDGPSKLQEKLMNLGFQVFRGNVEAPDFSLKNLDGDDISLSSYRGKLVFLNFWATWCGPCREEMPSMQALYDNLNEAGFEIVAVNLQESQRTVSKFINQNGYTFPVLLDSNGKVGGTYGARSIPTSYLIDTDGNAVGFIVGSRSWMEPEVKQTFNDWLPVGK